MIKLVYQFGHLLMIGILMTWEHNQLISFSSSVTIDPVASPREHKTELEEHSRIEGKL
jgi:hypothetical protein